MTRPPDLRWAIVASLFILGAIVVLGIVNPPTASIREAPGEAAAPAVAPGSEQAVFPLRSRPAVNNRRVDKAFQPSVGDEDGAPISF